MVIAQVLDFSFCMLQNGFPVWLEAVTAVQITLGALMCLLVTIQFIRQSLHMYQVTKRFEPSRYMNLVAREGLLYFLAYVCLSPSSSPDISHPAPIDQHAHVFDRQSDILRRQPLDQRMVDRVAGRASRAHVHARPTVYVESPGTVRARSSWEPHRHRVWVDGGLEPWRGAERDRVCGGGAERGRGDGRGRAGCVEGWSWCVNRGGCDGVSQARWV